MHVSLAREIVPLMSRLPLRMMSTVFRIMHQDLAGLLSITVMVLEYRVRCGGSFLRRHINVRLMEYSTMLMHNAFIVLNRPRTDLVNQEADARRRSVR